MRPDNNIPDSRSGGSPNPRPAGISIWALRPSRSKTPWWVRRGNLKHTHIVLVAGEWVWDQPWKGTPAAYRASEWAKAHDMEARGFTQVTVEVEDHDPWAFLEACKKIEGKRTRRILTFLRWFRLWPRPAWNCTSPIRVVVNALDPGFDLRGETPDALIEELCTQD